MNRICSLAIGTVLMFSLATAAPQIAKTGASAKGDKPAVEAQLKLLTRALDLTGEQQTRIKPVLEQLHDATIRLMHDGGLSREERLRRVTPARYQADGKVRAVLSEGQGEAGSIRAGAASGNARGAELNVGFSSEPFPRTG